jgi:hypothetical protein
MRPGDRVLLAAFATEAGLRELAGPTDDRDVLLAALEAADNAPVFEDFFPIGFQVRLQNCHFCIENLCYGEKVFAACARKLGCNVCCCDHHAVQEYNHGQRALSALISLLARLERLPGAKAVMFFHQNNVLYPGRLYLFSRQSADHRIGTHERLLEEVGAEATAARAAIYPLQAGGNQMLDWLAGQATNLGANLADFSGGDYSRAERDVVEVMDAARRTCRCAYRIAFQPLDATRSKMYKARVEVHGRKLPFAYRVSYLTPEDRAMQSAQAVMADARLGGDVAVSVGLYPEQAKGGRWSARVQVALEVDALQLRPVQDRPEGQFDVGALLSELDRDRSHEMLSGSLVRRPIAGATGMFILYERVIPDLRPGRHRISAFARNRDLNLYGGAETRLDLPECATGGLVGPLLRLAERRRALSPLPLLKDQAREGGGATEISTGPVPAASDGVPRGALVEMVSWLCGKPTRDDSKRRDGAAGVHATIPERFLLYAGRPIDRFPTPQLTEAGDCVELIDRIDTARLEPGEYEYRLVGIELPPESDAPPIPGTLAGDRPEPGTATFVVLDGPDAASP